MKKILAIISLLALVACIDKSQLVTSPSNVENGSITGLSASIICSGNTVAGIKGTADCTATSESDAVKICSGHTVAGITGTADCSVAFESDASKICTGQIVAGITGTADCSAASESDAAKICSGQTVSGITGTANCPVLAESDASKICTGQTVAGIAGTANCPVLAESDAAKICTGQTVAGITGTANCPGFLAEGFYVLSSRADDDTLDFNTLVVYLWGGANPLATRSVATFKDAKESSLLYLNNYSVIPRPLAESDGRYGDGAPEKSHYLETIISNNTGTTRASIQVCGASGNIDARIADCRSKNRKWSFYSGAQYGQVGEGDWSQVSVVENGGTKYEVWRDERTKLLWSDRSANEYNWYKAAGYSKDSTSSLAETTLDASPGGAYQPSQPISVCADVVDGKIAAGGGVYGNYAANPETAFKGNLSFANNVIWKLPSLSDWQLANVNGIRKVLPNTDNIFWSSSSSSYYRGYAWVIEAPEGFLYYWARENSFPVRCVGFVRD